jgi:hypothetical protein
MSSVVGASLTVGVQSITVSSAVDSDNNVYSTTSNSAGFFALIDATLPYLWLPRGVCDAFESLFKLRYEPATGHYVLNETVAEQNRRQKKTISFQLGGDLGPNIDSVTIRLPYEAFDLRGSPPTFKTPTPYFPIRRSENNTSIIGRAFLQETMLVVDYEHKNFSLTQVKFPRLGVPAQILAIGHTSGNAPKTGRQIGAVLAPGIVVPCVTLLLFSIAWCLMRRRSSRARAIETSHETQEMEAEEFPSELQSPSPPDYTREFEKMPSAWDRVELPAPCK